MVSAYTLTFGGLLLLGARAGDILGRRRVFMAGILLFTFASLLGGLAQEPWQLLTARALQGVGGAIASPTPLALITITFPEGPERNRAFGVFAAVSAGGGAIGLLAGGMLTEWLDWRWVLFVNVPIGVLIAALAPLYISESERHPGRFDIAGALTSTTGMASLVYAFIRAAEEGWRDSLTLGAFGAALVLLVAFVFTEMRAKEPITPLKMFADRNRSGTYVIMLSLAAAMFGMFFYIVLFVQNVLGYSPIKAGLAFLPVTVAIATGAGLSQRFLPVLGHKPFMVTGASLVVVGLTSQAFISPDSTYVGGVLGPMVIFGFGMGLNFVTVTVTAVAGVVQHEAGAASGLLNATQQVGESLGLSILTTVFGTASKDEAGKQLPKLLADGSAEQKAEFTKTHQLPAPWGHDVCPAPLQHQHDHEQDEPHPHAHALRPLCRPHRHPPSARTLRTADAGRTHEGARRVPIEHGELQRRDTTLRVLRPTCPTSRPAFHAPHASHGRRHPPRQRFHLLRPGRRRRPRLPGGQHAAHDGAGRVHVPADLRGRPERGLVVTKGPGGRPDGEGDGVMGRRAPPAAQHRRDGGRVGVVEHVPGPPETRADGALRDEGDHTVQQRLGAGRTSGGTGQRGGRGDGHGPDHGFPVLMCGVGGDLRLMGRLLGIVRVPGAQGGDPHRGAVAPGPLPVEQGRGQFAPVGALPDQSQQPVDSRTVPAVEVMVLCEGVGQSILIDAVVGGQDGHDGAGHLGVVGPLPRAGRQLTALQQGVVHRHEEL